jgi:hypothetical protein
MHERSPITVSALPDEVHARRLPGLARLTLSEIEKVDHKLSSEAGRQHFLPVGAFQIGW